MAFHLKVASVDGQYFPSVDSSNCVVFTEGEPIYIGQSNTSNYVRISSDDTTIANRLNCPSGISSTSGTVDVVGDLEVDGNLDVVGEITGNLDAGNVSSGTLPVSRGGTGTTTSTGTGSVVLNTDPAFLGTLTATDLNIVPNSLPVAGAIGWYKGDGWVDGVGWTNAADPGTNDIASFAGTFSTATDPSSGHTYVSGTTATSFTLPFTNSITDPYTFFHVARYNGANKKRIFDGTVNNWLSGFINDTSGAAFHGAWIVVDGISIYNWLISSDRPNTYRANGLDRTVYTVVGDAPIQISVNAGQHSSNSASDWAISEMIVFPTTLSDSDVELVEKYLLNKHFPPGVTISHAQSHNEVFPSAGVVPGDTLMYTSDPNRAITIGCTNSSAYLKVTNSTVTAPSFNCGKFTVANNRLNIDDAYPMSLTRPDHEVILSTHLAGDTFFMTSSNDGSILPTTTTAKKIILIGRVLTLLNNSGHSIGCGAAVYAPTFVSTSDDRLKSEESYIVNATETLNKLKPQTYRKRRALDMSNIELDENNNAFESGLIAQDIFYMAPELRHIVHIPEDASSNIYTRSNIEYDPNPQIDPDYSDWGTEPASVNYTSLIPYLIKAIQEKDAEIQSMKARLDAAGI